MLISYFVFWYLSFFLGLHLQHMEVPRPGVKSELQLSTSVTATARQDSSHICNLHHSSQQGWILEPLSEARDQLHVLMDISWVCFLGATLEFQALLNFLV